MVIKGLLLSSLFHCISYTLLSVLLSSHHCFACSTYVRTYSYLTICLQGGQAKLSSRLITGHKKEEGIASNVGRRFRVRIMRPLSRDYHVQLDTVVNFTLAIGHLSGVVQAG